MKTNQWKNTTATAVEDGIPVQPESMLSTTPIPDTNPVTTEMVDNMKTFIQQQKIELPTSADATPTPTVTTPAPTKVITTVPSTNKTFATAFAEGRKAMLAGGPKTFKWNNMEYGTDLATTVSTTTVPTKTPGFVQPKLPNPTDNSVLVKQIRTALRNTTLNHYLPNMTDAEVLTAYEKYTGKKVTPVENAQGMMPTPAEKSQGMMATYIEKAKGMMPTPAEKSQGMMATPVVQHLKTATKKPLSITIEGNEWKGEKQEDGSMRYIEPHTTYLGEAWNAIENMGRDNYMDEQGNYWVNQTGDFGHKYVNQTALDAAEKNQSTLEHIGDIALGIVNFGLGSAMPGKVNAIAQGSNILVKDSPTAIKDMIQTSKAPKYGWSKVVSPTSKKTVAEVSTHFNAPGVNAANLTGKVVNKTALGTGQAIGVVVKAGGKVLEYGGKAIDVTAEGLEVIAQGARKITIGGYNYVKQGSQWVIKETGEVLKETKGQFMEGLRQGKNL